VALLRARRARRGDLGGEARRAGELNGVLEAVVQVHALEQVRDRRLEARALLRVHLVRGHRLLLDLVQVRPERGEREVAVRALAHPHEPEDLRVVDHEHRVLVRQLRPEQDVQDPLVGGDGPALLRPVAVRVVAEALLAADHQQRVPRHRVHRLHAPALQHRQPAERVGVEPADRARGDDGDRRADDREAAGEPGDQLLELHECASAAAARRRIDLLIVMAKWTSSPTVTSTQEM
jgi:hypothetical protein